MRKVFTLILLVALSLQFGFAQSGKKGLRGDADAIADAEAMGGIEIWSQLKSVHSVHEWYPWHRIDSYVENEILDLTNPRSWVERKSEINLTIRAQRPEGKHWSVNNGEFAASSDGVYMDSMQRAPFNFYRLIRGVAIGDPFFEVRFGEGDIPRSRRLEFYGPDGVLGGWIILNARKEPIIKATTQYRYTLGPLKRFGNLWVPAWGVYENGTTRYQVISLKGDNQPPERSLFLPPAETRAE